MDRGEPKTTEYCLRCGESPESGTHINQCEYQRPPPPPSTTDVRLDRIEKRLEEISDQVRKLEDPAKDVLEFPKACPDCGSTPVIDQIYLGYVLICEECYDGAPDAGRQRLVVGGCISDAIDLWNDMVEEALEE